MAQVRITLTGTTPLLMHNIELADPLNPVAKQIAEITKKRKKSDEDFYAIDRLEWFGGLYLGDVPANGTAKNGAQAHGGGAAGKSKGTDEAYANKCIIMPTRNIRKCLIMTARTLRQGKDIERALVFPQIEVPFYYDGPQNPLDLWSDEAFRFRCAVKLKGVIQRMRPQFPTWTIAAEAQVLTDLLNIDDLRHIVDLAGKIEGLGDGRVIGRGRFHGKVENIGG